MCVLQPHAFSGKKTKEIKLPNKHSSSIKCLWKCLCLWNISYEILVKNCCKIWSNIIISSMTVYRDYRIQKHQQVCRFNDVNTTESSKSMLDFNNASFSRWGLRAAEVYSSSLSYYCAVWQACSEKADTIPSSSCSIWLQTQEVSRKKELTKIVLWTLGRIKVHAVWSGNSQKVKIGMGDFLSVFHNKWIRNIFVCHSYQEMKL